MQKEDFARLLNKYNQGQCTDAEIRLIDRWYDQLGADNALGMSEDERRNLKKRLWQQIDNQTRDTDEASAQPEKQSIRLPVFTRWAAAAAVFLLVGLGAWFFSRNQSDSPASVMSRADSDSGFIERTNNTDKPQSIALEDGTLIHLQPQSTIRYARQLLPDKRETWLTGKAFFQVKKDPHRPFLVYSGSIVTRVLGTSFWVTAPTNAPTVEVAVHTGKVAVFKKALSSAESTDETGEAASVVLTQNQKVTIFVDENRLTKGLIEQPSPIQNPIHPEPAPFAFDDSPLPEVLKQLERAYGIEMAIGNEALTNCRFTGNITQQPLYSKLELLCQAIGAQYEVQGTRILISGSGCAP